VPEEPAATDWAYAAGSVDGEGCIAIVRSFSATRERYYYGVTVVVTNTDRRVLDWLCQLGSGHVQAMGSGLGLARKSWAWRSPSGPGAQRFIEGIRPWLRMKIKQCDNALAMIALLNRSKRTLGRRPIPPEWLAEQERHYWIQRELNHRGSAAFFKRAMHSPRQINRERARVANMEF
jgi:hypothetical protein